jgi:hypothetical protein
LSKSDFHVSFLICKTGKRKDEDEGRMNREGEKEANRHVGPTRHMEHCHVIQITI